MAHQPSDCYVLALYAIQGSWKHDPNEALLQFQRCPQLLTRRKGSLLHLMIEHDRWLLLESILKDHPELIWHQNDKRMSLLYFAVMLRKYDMAEYLVRIEPALTQMIAKNLKTPLHLACANTTSRTHGLQALLPKVGSAIAAVSKDRHGCTPLHYYAQFGPYDFSLISTLLHLSTLPLSMRNKKGQTPYMMAIDDKYSIIATFLGMFEDQRGISARTQSIELVRRNRFVFYFQSSLTVRLLSMIPDVPASVLAIK